MEKNDILIIYELFKVFLDKYNCRVNYLNNIYANKGISQKEGMSEFIYNQIEKGLHRKLMTNGFTWMEGPWPPHMPSGEKSNYWHDLHINWEQIMSRWEYKMEEIHEVNN